MMGSYYVLILLCVCVLLIFGLLCYGCLYVMSFSNVLVCFVFFFKKMVVELLIEVIKYNFCLNNW